MGRALALVLSLVATGCASMISQEPALLASGRMTSDFGSYSIRRVGLLPILGDDGGAGDEYLAEAFQTELVRATAYQIVPLHGSDLLETAWLEPFRRGAYDPATLLELRRRFRLDAVAVGTVTARRVVPPQRLGVQLDLVSCETGATLWSASVMLDASDRATRDSLARWAEQHTELRGGIDLVLLSPRRFTRFAAWQIAQLL